MPLSRALCRVTFPRRNLLIAVTGLALALACGGGGGGSTSNQGTPNQAPTFSSIAPTTAKEGHAYSYSLNVTDANGDAITLALATSPTGATLDTATKSISWTPNSAQVGIAQSFDVLASDGKGGSTHQTWALTPSANAAPAFTSTAAGNGTTGTAYAYTPLATDADGDTVTYTLVTKPSWASLSGGVVAGTPMAGGVCNFTVRADDGHGKTMDQSWTTLIIPNGNRAPVITSNPGLAATGGTAYTYTLQSTDPDGDAVTYEMASFPNGASISGSTITWTPTADQERVTASFIVQAKDVWGAVSTPQTWALAPSGTIRGTRVINYSPLNWNTGKITMDPLPETTTQIHARVPSSPGSTSFTTLSGTYNAADGSYQVGPVPAGSYWLAVNSTSFVWTDKSRVNLNGFAGGRKDALNASISPTNLSVSLTAMTPWITGDYLQLFEWNSHSYIWLDQDNGASGVITPGATVVTGLSDDWARSLNTPALIDMTKGDHPLVIHMATQTVGSERYQVAKEVFEPSSLTMADGTPSTLAGNFVPLAASATSFTFNWARSAFTAYQSAVSPVASPDFSFAYLTVAPDIATIGFRGISGDLFQYLITDPTRTTDVNLGNISIPILPGHMDMYFYACNVYKRTYLLPGTNISSKVNGYLVLGTTNLPTASSPARPLVSPVQNPKINGSSLLGDLWSVGLTPTLSWTAPALGTPTGYTVYIYKLSQLGSQTMRSYVATLITTANNVAVPEGLLQPGSGYTFTIRAYASPNWDPTTTPYGAFSGSAIGYADALSGIIQP